VPGPPPAAARLTGIYTQPHCQLQGLRTLTNCNCPADQHAQGLGLPALPAGPL